MNQKWLFVSSGKIKISCWAFLDGHPVKILKLSYQDMNQKCKTDQTSHIHFLQDLKQTCTQKYNHKCNQLLNFSVHMKNYIWFISGWLLDAYRLGFMKTTKTQSYFIYRGSRSQGGTDHNTFLCCYSLTTAHLKVNTQHRIWRVLFFTGLQNTNFPESIFWNNDAFDQVCRFFWTPNEGLFVWVVFA